LPGRGFALLAVPAGTTLTVQVRRTIEQLVVRGVWLAGSRIPSSRQLAADLGLSRTTVQAAYQALIDEGYLVSADRRGLFVNEVIRNPMRDFNRQASGWESAVDWDRVLIPSRQSPWPELRRQRNWYTFEYPFVTGQHDRQYFPRGAWLKALRRALDEDHRHASLDDVLDDDPRLVEALCTRVLPSRGLAVAPENVLVTLGSQQGLQLISAATVRWGDRVAVENPGYVDARHVFHHAGARVVNVPVDSAGLVPQENYDGARLLFVTPSHQHPTNVTLSIERRMQLIRQANEHDFLIIEDDYDSELRYRGKPSPSMASLDPSGRTIYLGTMSKVLAPGLRVGYLVGPKAFIDRVREIRRYSHRQPPGHLQRAVSILFESGDFATAQRKYRKALAERWLLASDAAERAFPAGQVMPPGGTGLWLRLELGMDSDLLAQRAKERGILFDSGSLYFAGEGTENGHIRVGFGAIEAEKIPRGMDRLVELLRERS